MSLQRFKSLLEAQDGLVATGTVGRVVGLVLEIEGLKLPIGARVRIEPRGLEPCDAEIVGFRESRALAIPGGSTAGIARGDRVVHDGAGYSIPVGSALLGRVIDANGEPMDGKGPIAWETLQPIENDPVSPMKRLRIKEPLETGVRAIDGLLTCGRGQRLGIFAGSGVGKSVLLGMLARGALAPVSVIALVGERGREVREFVERDLGEEGLARSVVVVATSDQPPVLRLRAAKSATAIAESFRDQGTDVVFMLDSVTRVALAQREVGLSAFEPPTTKAFPPSVFSLLARLLERTGPGESATITSFYTVLVEGDDEQDPIGDAVRGILDGHVWLSRDLASEGHFPAIDVLGSVSRVQSDVAAPKEIELARTAREDLSRFRDSADLIQLGAYARGADARTDRAVDRRGDLRRFLVQGSNEHSSRSETIQRMQELFPEIMEETVTA